jgi:hypothetical protein
MSALPPKSDTKADGPHWVISCRDGSNFWCPLYPRKLPRKSKDGTSALGHEETHALEQSLGDSIG